MLRVAEYISYNYSCIPTRPLFKGLKGTLGLCPPTVSSQSNTRSESPVSQLKSSSKMPTKKRPIQAVPEQGLSKRVSKKTTVFDPSPPSPSDAPRRPVARRPVARGPPPTAKATRTVTMSRQPPPTLPTPPVFDEPPVPTLPTLPTPLVFDEPLAPTPPVVVPPPLCDEPLAPTPPTVDEPPAVCDDPPASTSCGPPVPTSDGPPALYSVPRKVARQSERQKYGFLKGVSLGYLWKNSFEKNIKALRATVKVKKTHTPAEIHFHMNKVMYDWSHHEGGCAVANRLKAWTEQEWPEAFTSHANVPNAPAPVLVD